MLAIITDSTSDLSAEQLQSLNVMRVALNVHFQGQTHRDWLDITPADIIRGVQGGADLPTTSQPSPADFGKAYQDAAATGATEVLVVTISGELSGTYQSANLAAKDSPLPVSIVDSRQASAGISALVRRAVQMRAEGADLATIVAKLESMKPHMTVLFTVGGLEFLQKGGRVGRASALLGGLLNIKPILTLEEGKIVPAARARGTKKAIAEMVERLRAHIAAHPGELVLDFLHVQDPEAAKTLEQAVRDAGIPFTKGELVEIGAVISAHTGPGTFAVYAHNR